MGSGSDFTKGSILKNYEYNMSTQKILENYEILRSQGKQHILTFVPSIENGQELKRKNRDFEMISAKTPNKERAAIITAFKKGEIPNLINVIALTTGFDAPIIDAIIKARSTNSIGLNYQMDGRAVRPLIDKKGNITRTKKTILDLSGNFDRFGKIDGITFEKQDYTKGWGMWNDGRLMSGLVNYERDKVIAYYEKAKNKPSTTINITKEKQLAEEVEFNFGKHKGRKVADIIKTERSYISWMMRDITFSPFNKHIQVAVMELLSKEVFNSE